MKPRCDITFRRASEKSRASVRPEIVRRSFPLAGSWERGRPIGRQEREPDKASRNPARAVAGIPGWPANPGLCSSRAIGALSPEIPATTPFSFAIFAPGARPNFLGCPSLPVTLAWTNRKSVFTHTQKKLILTLFALQSAGHLIKPFHEGIKSSSPNWNHEATGHGIRSSHQDDAVNQPGF